MEDPGSSMRRLVHESAGRSYRSLPSLDVARSTSGAVVVLEGDDGGQIYLTCPAQLVRATEPELHELLAAIDEEQWPGNPSDMRRVSFEVPNEPAIAGGMGGGKVLAGLWLHPRLDTPEWRRRVEAVVIRSAATG